MGRFSGVTLDWYDDNGQTLRSKFPTPESLPDVIKEASVQPPEKLTPSDFALVALDSGGTIFKFACHDPGTTAMSVIYFMEHGDKLPEEAQKTAAWNLLSKCSKFDLTPPAALFKLATSSNGGKYLDKTGSVCRGPVDITGQSPRPTVKTASPKSASDYAVTVNGKGYYPLHTWDLVKKAEVYFQDEHKRMDPEMRRQYACKLAAKASLMGYPLDPQIVEAGSPGWASSGHLKAAVEMRKATCPPGDSRKLLDELYEKRASVDPNVYAEILRRFDIERGLDRSWDRIIPDPWASTFGMNKTADLIWEEGADRVSRDEKGVCQRPSHYL
jgi:hypothetical protein